MDIDLTQNRRARYDYEVIETFECGIVLSGQEVKSMRKGQAHFNGTYVSIRRGEAWLHHFHIPLYENSNLEGYNPEQDRKLLLHKKELIKIEKTLSTEGVTLVPLKAGLAHQRIKLVIALVKGKKTFDKRQTIKDRDITRRIERNWKSR